MKRNYSYWIILSCLMLIFSSCEKLLDKDISSDKLNVLAPGDSLRTAILTQTFWWDKLDGATSYNLQIVTPDFENPSLIMDTTITANRIAVTLKANTQYQWRVLAKNGYSNTEVITRTLYVDNSNDLSIQSIAGLVPAIGDSVAAASSGSVTLKWTTLPIANSYIIKIDTLSTTVVKRILTDTVTVSGSDSTKAQTQIETTLLKKGGYYKWSIQAFNSKPSHTPEMADPLPTFKVKAK